MSWRTLPRVSSLMSSWLRRALDTVTTDTPSSRAMSFIRTTAISWIVTKNAANSLFLAACELAAGRGSEWIMERSGCEAAGEVERGSKRAYFVARSAAEWWAERDRRVGRPDLPHDLSALHAGRS